MQQESGFFNCWSKNNAANTTQYVALSLESKLLGLTPLVVLTEVTLCLCASEV